MPACTTWVDATIANTTQINDQRHARVSDAADDLRSPTPERTLADLRHGELGHHQLDREPGRQRRGSDGGDQFPVDNTLYIDNGTTTVMP